MVARFARIVATISVVLSATSYSTPVSAQISAGIAQAPPLMVKSAPQGQEQRGFSESELSALKPIASLLSAAIQDPEKLANMMERRRQGAEPFQEGFSRSFPVHKVLIGRSQILEKRSPVSYAGGKLVIRSGAARWVAAVEVADAAALRIGLKHLVLPPGSTLWTYSDSGTVRGPLGREVVGPEGTAWLPRVQGPRAYVEVRVPEAALEDGESASFDLSSVVQIFPSPKALTDCNFDATCVVIPAMLANLKKAVAYLEYVVGGGGYSCTGTLVNDKVSSLTPYLLTAHHCFSDQSAASSLTAYFFYQTSSCSGTAPPISTLPSASGSTLLATNSASDFTFVRLSGLPGGYSYYLMGWTTVAPQSGEKLYQVSHPQNQPQNYSDENYASSGGITCSDFPRPNFLYGNAVVGTNLGSIEHGSSGAALVDSAGHIVGQLYGPCHYDSWDWCSYSTFYYMDGAFATTYPYISQWLDPSVAPPTATTDSATNIGQTSATFNATVNPNGSSTTVYFDYGGTSNYGASITYGSVGSGTSNLYPAQSVSGLLCGTTVHYRVRATSSGGTSYGSDRSFTTTACSPNPPTVTTNAPTNIGQTTATFNATVNPNGSSTTVYFDYGGTASYGASITYGSVGSGTSNLYPAQSVSGLLCGTTVHYRVRATNSGGTSYGSDRSFTTTTCAESCDSAGVSYKTIATAQVYGACRQLTVGPSVTISSTGVATLESGETVVLLDGFQVASGGSLIVRTCGHSLCSSGSALAQSCHSCVTAVCTQDSYCCSNSWDSYCVDEVGTICGLTCP